jgi:hypothetical protein
VSPVLPGLPVFLVDLTRLTVLVPVAYVKQQLSTLPHTGDIWRARVAPSNGATTPTKY